MTSRRTLALAMSTTAAALVDARSIKHSSHTCYDKFGNKIACPVSKAEVIIIIVLISVVVLAIVGFFFFRIFRRRRAQKYQALPIPPSHPTGLAQEGVITPAAPGEMGYAGPQPQLPYTYNPPQYVPPEGNPYTPPAPQTPYAPPQGPPPSQSSAATHYGYSVGAI